MKKVSLIIASILLMSSIYAQDLVSKKGFKILPETGDYSLGIDARPFLYYAGNIFNGNVTNASPDFDFTAPYPMIITGKYFITDKIAYRGVFRLGMNSITDKNYVQQDGQSDPLVTVEDKYTYSSTDIALGGGIEYRRGHGRVQGYYGGMAMLTFGSDKYTYKYGNAHSSTNVNPTRTNFGRNSVGGGTWVLEDINGSTFGFNVFGFIGVEYYVAPKLSISGEFSYGFGFQSKGNGKYKLQSWDAANNAVKTTEGTQGGNSRFGLDTGVSSALNINFYF